MIRNKKVLVEALNRYKSEGEKKKKNLVFLESDPEQKKIEHSQSAVEQDLKPNTKLTLLCLEYNIQ